MPTKPGSVIEELLTLAEKALEHALASRSEIKKHARHALSELAGKCDLVTRDEFEAAIAMISKAPMIQEDLKERVSAIEKKVNLSSVSKKVTTKKQSLRSVKHSNRRKRRQ